jgi:hypothetical protein
MAMKRYLVLLLMMLIKASMGMAVSDVVLKYWADPDHEEMTLKAIDLLIEKGELSDHQKEELERYREAIKDGSEAEDGRSENYWAPRRTDNHAYDPRTGLGKYNHASALAWAKGAYDLGNKKENKYDWYDALEYYLEEDNKDDAYFCLGYVCHLLQDVSLPPHTIPSIKDGKNGIKKGYPPLPHPRYEKFIHSERRRFLEKATSIIKKKNLNKFFKCLAKESRRFGDRFRRSDNLDDPDIYGGDAPALVYDKRYGIDRHWKEVYSEIGKEIVPLAVGYTAGLIKYFYDLTHLEVKRTSPQDGEEDVSIHTSIIITFDQPIDLESFILDETFFISPETQGTFSLS